MTSKPPELGDMAAKLLTLLDRIDIEEDWTLAAQRHAIAVEAGFTVEFGESLERLNTG